MSALACEMELAPEPDGAARVGFRVRNDGGEPVELLWFEPFLGFEIEAEVAGEPARVMAGAYDGGAQPVHDVLAAGEERAIATPVTIVFDPGPQLPHPGPPTRWRIAHEPADAVLRATVQLGQERLSCETTLRPAAEPSGG